MTATWLDRLTENYRRLLGAAGVSGRARQGEGQPEGRTALRVAVVTDSAAALPEDCLADPQVRGLLRVVPMPVLIGEQIYAEGADELTESLALALAEGKPIQTSRPSPGQFLQAYEELEAQGFDAVVSVHISGALSGTVEAAGLAARSAGIPVSVVDSRSVAMGLGFAVLAALVAAAEGRDPEAVRAAAETAAAGAQVLFYVPSLEQLRRGGRISKAAGLVGTLLAVKPILGITDGQIVPVEKVRSASRAITRLEELVRDRAAAIGPSCQLAVHYFGTEGQAREIGRRLAGVTGNEVLVSPLPAVLAAHAGAGILVLALAAGPVPDAVAEDFASP